MFKVLAKVDENTIQKEEDEKEEEVENEGGEEGEEVLLDEKIDDKPVKVVKKPFEKAITNGPIKVLNTLDDSIYSLTFVSMIKDI